MSGGSNPKIGLVIITDKLDEENAAFTAVQNFINIHDDIVDSISIFGPEQMSINEDQVKSHSIDHQSWSSPLVEVVGHLSLQFRIAHKLLKKRNELDIVFFHLGGTILLLPLLISRIFGQSPTVIVTGSIERSYIEQRRETRITKCVAMFINIIETISSRVASRVVFLSESMKSELQMQDSERAVTANLNYIEINKFGDRIPESHREFDFIFVGRFEEVKGVIKFIRAISILVENNPDMKILIVGDGSLRQRVERRVKKGGIEDNVKLTGWVKHEEVIELLRNSKYLVLPSESEGVPKTILEAMACGTVPIATSVGGVPDIIENNKNGFLLTSNEPVAMSEQLHDYSEKTEWEVLSVQARGYICSEHSFTKRKQEYAELLRDICS